MEGREKKDESMLVPSSKERFKDALVEGTRRKKVTREKREEKTKKNKKKERNATQTKAATKRPNSSNKHKQRARLLFFLISSPFSESNDTRRTAVALCRR